MTAAIASAPTGTELLIIIGVTVVGVIIILRILFR